MAKQQSQKLPKSWWRGRKGPERWMMEIRCSCGFFFSYCETFKLFPGGKREMLLVWGQLCIYADQCAAQKKFPRLPIFVGELYLILNWLGLMNANFISGKCASRKIAQTFSFFVVVNFTFLAPEHHHHQQKYKPWFSSSSFTIVTCENIIKERTKAAGFIAQSFW